VKHCNSGSICPLKISSVNRAIKRERLLSEFHTSSVEEGCLTISIETAHPAEGVSVKVISGVSGGVEVSDHTFLVSSAEIRDLSDQ
jgi:hypothetical protein